MNCLTPEAISSYVRASMEARQEAARMSAAYARPSFAERISSQIDLGRLLDIFRRNFRRKPKVRVYDAG